MSPNVVALLYLASGVLFILALRGLSSPATSRQGNLFGMIGMAIAVLTTLGVANPSSIVTWGLIAGACLGVLALAAWILRLILDPVTSLTVAAEAIAAGDYQHRVYVGNRDELGMLAQTFNRIGQQLGGRMSEPLAVACRRGRSRRP